MKNGVWGLGLILAAVAGYVIVGPYLTVAEIKSGIVEKDSEKLSENIEFPILRQNLKEQLNAAMMKDSAMEFKDNPYVAALATKMVDGIVDSFVTPSGLASIMEGKKPSKNNTESVSMNDLQKKELFKNARYSYDSHSKFSIWVPNGKGEEVGLVLKRNGFSWKLVNIVMPMDERL